VDARSCRRVRTGQGAPCLSGRRRRSADVASLRRHPPHHASPSGSDIAVEIPAKVKKAIGLDDARSWIVVSDYNVDRWPNAGLSPVPEHEMAFSYGFIPPGLFKQVNDAFIATHEAKRARGIRRR